MNLFQVANGGATFLILSALVSGLAQAIAKLEGDPLAYLLTNHSILCLGAFIVVFRIKTLLDDHKHFGEPHQGTNTFRYIGFILAVISWIFWAIAAYCSRLPSGRVDLWPPALESRRCGSPSML